MADKPVAGTLAAAAERVNKDRAAMLASLNKALDQEAGFLLALVKENGRLRVLLQRAADAVDAAITDEDGLDPGRGEPLLVDIGAEGIHPDAGAWHAGTVQECWPEDKIPRAEVINFAMLMERQLQAHDDRPGWKTMGRATLMGRLQEEKIELERVLLPFGKPHDPRAVGKEAADVANFAMMIADVCGALPQEVKGG